MKTLEAQKMGAAMKNQRYTVTDPALSADELVVTFPELLEYVAGMNSAWGTTLTPEQFSERLDGIMFEGRVIAEPYDGSQSNPEEEK